MQCLELEFLPGFLFGITSTRLKADLQEKVNRYRRECVRILWRAFQADVQLVVGAPLPPAPETLSLVQIREIGIAVQHFAEQAIAHEQRLHSVESRLDNAARFMGHIQKRLEQVEERVAPGALLTEEQEAALNSRVKALGVILASLGQRNPWQGIWTELFRHLGVSDSKHIPQAKFAPAMDFLETWVRSLTTAGGAPPA